MRPPLRFAIFGAGFWTRYQLPAWRELRGAECVAIYNRTAARAGAVARDFGIPAVYVDPEKLLRDCIVEVQKGGARCEVADLPEEILELLDQRMAEEDPQADISMLLSCPKCSYQWEMPFDICSYLWIEIDNWAKRALREVAMLAAAFGWSESDILNMSPRRRRLYLEMIRQ